MDLAGRSAVVTGAARGIGRAVAEACAAAGMRLVLADIDGDELERTVGTLRTTGARAIAVSTDVARAADVERLADAAFAQGEVNLVCLNAGVACVGRSWELSLDEWRRVIDVNLWGVIHGVRSFVPLMIASGTEGHVLAIASMASLMARPEIAPYTVAKHGVLGLGETLARELQDADAPIGVSIVFPGRVATTIGGGAPSGPDVQTPERVAARALDAVRDDELFVLTHPERAADVHDRTRAIAGVDGS
jgi:NAD(P)-dependent dehydrogenase (short-subunit alcohol dehydrogenase family)